MALRLPIFPLDVVLLPGVPLPLHIFEPRYRRMLADCLAGDRRFGITAPGRLAEVPEFGTLGCIAVIASEQTLPDGRANVVVVGERRFAIVAIETDDAPYHVATVEPFDDVAGGEAPSGEDVGRMRELFAQYLALLNRLHDLEATEFEPHPDPAHATFQIAGALDDQADFKRRILATRSAGERVALLLRALPAFIAFARDATVVHTRAKGNGKGHGAPPIAGAG